MNEIPFMARYMLLVCWALENSKIDYDQMTELTVKCFIGGDAGKIMRARLSGGLRSDEYREGNFKKKIVRCRGIGFIGRVRRVNAEALSTKFSD